MAEAADRDLQVTTKVFDDTTNDETSRRAIRVIIQHIHDDGGVFLGIGVISHAPTRAKTALREHAQQYRCCNWALRLCETENSAILKRLHKKAIDCVREIPGANLDGFNDGYEPSRPAKPKHLYNVVALVQRKVKYESNIQTSFHNIVVKINQYLGHNQDLKFYIGITSGPDAITAMRQRRTGDEYKDLHGINRMIVIFKSKDQQKCRNKEKKLTDHYRADERCLNRTGGGGGRDTKQPWSFVYLGLKRPT